MYVRLGSAVLMLISSSMTSAAVILDQEVVTNPDTGYLGYILDYPGDFLAQTFTMRHSGMLKSVGVQVSIDENANWPYSPPSDDLHLRIVRTTPAGVPIFDGILAEETIDRFSLPRSYRPGPFANVDLSNWQVNVRAGEVLAITLHSNQAYYTDPDGSNYIWYRSPRSTLPGGEFFIYVTSDLWT